MTDNTQGTRSDSSILPDPRTLCVVVALLVITYSVYCALIVPATYDEAWSWSSVRDSSLRGVVSYEQFSYANNHLLNSLWLAVSNALMPDNLQAMRLPSLLSIPLTALGLLLLLRRAHCNALAPLVMAAILLHPAVLRHTFLARGYAVAVAAQVVSLYGAVAFSETRKRRFLLLSLVAATVSALSIFSFVYFLAGLCAWAVGTQLWLHVEDLNKAGFARLLRRGLFLPESLIFLLTVAYIYPVSRKVVDFDPYIPGSPSFLFGTYASLLTDMVGQDLYPSVLRILAKLLITLVTAAAVVGTIRVFSKQRRLFGAPLGTIGLVIALSVAALYGVRFATATPFPMGRAALFLLVPSLVYLPLLGRELLGSRALVWCVMLAGPLVINFAYVDLHQTRALLIDGPREVLSALRSTHDATDGEARFVRLDISPAWRYYKHILDLEDLQVDSVAAGELTQKTAAGYDYLYLPAETYQRLRETSLGSEFHELGWFRDDSHVLVANRSRSGQPVGREDRHGR